MYKFPISIIINSYIKIFYFITIFILKNFGLYRIIFNAVVLDDVPILNFDNPVLNTLPGIKLDFIEISVLVKGL